MFSQTWKKYLPVILILLKRSSQGDQTLSMDHADFERAAGGRKIKFSFNNLRLTKLKMNTDNKHTNVAIDLATVLQEDLTAKQVIMEQHLEFSMNNACELSIKNTTPVAVPVEELEEAAAM
ncbi:MAG: hypothetical protein V4717_11380 [Bacteroidota bacterium]